MYDEVRRRVRGRRCRTVARSAFLAAAVVTAAGGLALLARDTDDVATEPATGVARSDQSALAAVVRVEARAAAGVNGTEEVTVVFDRPLPSSQITRLQQIADADASGLQYVIQGPSGLKVCGDTHWFPGELGTVDLLIPSGWLSEDTSMTEVPVETTGTPGKVPLCGPHRGYVQVAIWGPATDDPAQVHVTVEDGGRRLVARMDPAGA